MEALPVQRAAPNLVTATRMLPTSAPYTAVLDEFFDAILTRRIYDYREQSTPRINDDGDRFGIVHSDRTNDAGDDGLHRQQSSARRACRLSHAPSLEAPDRAPAVRDRHLVTV